MNAGLCTVLLRDVSKAKLHFKKGLQISDPEGMDSNFTL